MTSGTIRLVSRGIVHPAVRARRYLYRLLQSHAGTTVQATSRMSDLLDLDPGSPAVTVLYLHHPADHPSVVDSLDRYVAAGGSLLAVHSAAASFKTSDRYASLLGGTLSGHDRVAGFEVEPVPGRLPGLASGRPFTVVDELYRHRFVGDIMVQYLARYHDGAEPVVWVRNHGTGRVACFALGHRAQVFRSASTRSIILGLLDWLTAANRESRP